MEIILAGTIAAAAVLFLILKFGKLRRILAFDKWIDMFVTVVIGIMFFGTFSGMMVAVTAGCIVSAFLYFAKRMIGSERLTFRGWVEDQPSKFTNPVRDFMQWRKSWPHGHSSHS